MPKFKLQTSRFFHDPDSRYLSSRMRHRPGPFSLPVIYMLPSTCTLLGCDVSKPQ